MVDPARRLLDPCFTKGARVGRAAALRSFKSGGRATIFDDPSDEAVDMLIIDRPRSIPSYSWSEAHPLHGERISLIFLAMH